MLLQHSKMTVQLLPGGDQAKAAIHPPLPAILPLALVRSLALPVDLPLSKMTDQLSVGVVVVEIHPLSLAHSLQVFVISLATITRLPPSKTTALLLHGA